MCYERNTCPFILESREKEKRASFSVPLVKQSLLQSWLITHGRGRWCGTVVKEPTLESGVGGLNPDSAL